MTGKKRGIPTKTISFRLDAKVVDNIIDAAKRKKVTVQEYFVTQIDPLSELGKFLKAEQAKILLREDHIVGAAVDFITGLAQIKEQNGLDGETFNEAIKESMLSLFKQKTIPKTGENEKGE